MSIRSAWWLAALPLLTACGVEEGDYLVYRVNVSAFTSSASCYPMEMIPIEEAEDSNTLRQGQTWVLYLAAADKLVLDAAGQAMRGGESDDGYLFRADDIDVTYVGDEQREAKVTAQVKTTINMFTDGSAVNGDIERAETLTCDFLTATPSPGACQAIPDCLRQASFSGVELDDVELTEGVDRNPPLPPMP